jgi:predicted nucleotidyltransferase component of viral defense system
MGSAVIDPRTAKGDFADLCRIAADAMGSDNPALLAILEKDYWVTRVLCAVAEAYADQVIFKGGTSLSKGFGLTQRFSEDIDLVVDTGERGEAARDSLLKDIAKTVSEHCSMDATVRHSGNGVHRAVAYGFEATWSGGELLQPTILLEMGTRSALEPREPRRLQTMIAVAFPEAAAELPSCEMQVLKADRTFVEKLFVVHGTVVRHLEDPATHNLTRIGRHYYDLDRLLSDHELVAVVGSAEYWAMIEDCDLRSARDFPHAHRAPKGLDFSQSPALFPDEGIREVLTREYQRDRPLFFGEFPSLPEVLARLTEVRPSLRR